jgi:hypothetical protein
MALNFGPIRWVTIVRTAAAAGVVVLTACSTGSPSPKAATEAASPPSVSTTASTASPAASTPSPSPSIYHPPSPPFPQVSSAAVAGWQTVTSLHWVGYTFPVGEVTGVRAQWKEPSVTGTAINSEESAWIGIGGWNDTEQSLLQAGTSAYFPYGDSPYPDEEMWYELIPKSTQYPNVFVNPGDEIAASIVQLDPPREKWQLLVYDVTSGLSFKKTVQYDSLGAYPSFVEEDPSSGPITSTSMNGPFVPIPRWGSVSFSNMQIRIGDQWRPAASIYGYRVQMVRNGRTLATAGPLDRASGFTAHQRP